MSVPKGVKTSPVWAMRMGCAESLARPKIATIEKMKARVQIKTETEDCSPYSKAHIEGEVRQHCAHEVASRAVEEQR